MPTLSGHSLPVLLLSGWPLGPNIHHRKAGEGLGRHQNSQSENSYSVVEEVFDIGILMARWRQIVLEELQKMWMVASRSSRLVF